MSSDYSAISSGVRELKEIYTNSFALNDAGSMIEYAGSLEQARLRAMAQMQNQSFHQAQLQAQASMAQFGNGLGALSQDGAIGQQQMLAALARGRHWITCFDCHGSFGVLLPEERNKTICDDCLNKKDRETQFKKICSNCHGEFRVRVSERERTICSVCITSPQKVDSKPKEKEMFSFYSGLKEYVKRHGDIIFTAMFIMAADKFFFNGALKGALQRLMEKLLAKADLHIDKTELGK